MLGNTHIASDVVVELRSVEVDTYVDGPIEQDSTGYDEVVQVGTGKLHYPGLIKVENEYQG